MSKHAKAILALIDEHPDDNLLLYKALYAVLSEQQQRIIKVLAEAISLNVTQITERIGATHQVTSAQLFQLRKLKLVCASSKVQRNVYYFIPGKHENLKDSLNQHYQSDDISWVQEGDITTISPENLASIQQGLKQAKNGQTKYLGSFSEYAEIGDE